MHALPAPSTLGLPPRFRHWRPSQPRAIEFAWDSAKRFVALVLPTGVGKSLNYMALSQLTSGRTAVLTATKGLQDQLGAEYHSMGLHDLRGQTSYACLALPRVTVAEGACHLGLPCPLRARGCLYYDAVDRAQATSLLVTNYQAWLAQYEHGEGLGEWDTLVLDEAHAAPEQLAQYLTIQLTDRALEDAQCSRPPETTELGPWRLWARKEASALEDRLQGWTRPDAQRLRARRTLDALDRIGRMEPDRWVMTSDHREHTFHPIDPAPWAERLLFRKTPKVILTSATLSLKTASLLGLTPDQCDLFQADSSFPVDRRPLWHVDTCKIDFNTSAADDHIWLSRLDSLLRARRDRKGIIHTISYDRARKIREYSEFVSSMHWNGSAVMTPEAVASFKRAGPGAILVSPSVTTGYDFPDAECEFQVIVKIPFPPPSPLLDARVARDPDYRYYVAMQQLIQIVGRGMRSTEDRCESLILDNNCHWFLGHGPVSCRRLAPRWFLQAYKHLSRLPTPPPLLPD